MKGREASIRSRMKPLAVGLAFTGMVLVVSGFLIAIQDFGSCPANTPCFHTFGVSGIYIAPLGLAVTSVGAVLALSGVVVLLASRPSLARILPTRVAVLAPILGLGLLLLSSVNAQHVLEVDYEAINYGYPLPWLVHYLAGVSPVNLWLPNVVGVFVDYATWLLVSVILIGVLSLPRNSRRPASTSQTL